MSRPFYWVAPAGANVAPSGWYEWTPEGLEYLGASILDPLPTREAHAVPELVTVARVAQEHRNGCTAAAVAMIVGKTYDEVQRCSWQDFSNDGVLVQLEDWLEYLFQQGFVSHRVYRVTQLEGMNHERAAWPPPPFAPVHLCSVMGSRGGHAVVMRANGEVLDPAAPGIFRLSDYAAVSMVLGLWKLRRAVKETSDG